MPSEFDFLIQKGVDFINSGKLSKAKNVFTNVLKEDSKNTTALNNLGIIYVKRGNIKIASKLFRNAIKIKPNSVEPIFNLGNIYFNKGEFKKAIKLFNKIKHFASRQPSIYFNLATSYGKTKDIINSEKFYRYYLSLKPRDNVALTNLGVIYSRQGNFAKAEKYFKKSLKVNSDNSEAHFNFGITLSKQVDYKKAVKHYKKAHKLDHHSQALAHLVGRLPYLCEWEEFSKFSLLLDKQTKNELVKKKIPSEQPFMNVVRNDNPKLNYEIAKAYSRRIEIETKKVPKSSRLKNPIKPKKSSRTKSRLKIGYVSDGFRDFPTGQNICGLLENHDQKKYEIFAYSYGPDDGSSWRKRIKKAVGHFIDIQTSDNLSIAKKIQQDNIDILVDLKGHTSGSRLDIFGLKPAPIQITYLGYPGTTGANFIDYIIADKIVIPKDHIKYFSEKIIYLPPSYRPTDNKAKIIKTPFEKKDFNIPENTFVFSSFNSTYKLDINMFETWMNILKKVPDGVLWQLQDSADIGPILKKQANNLGVNPRRIIMAEKLPKETHLSRMSLVNIALDTRIVNGHTTTVDALWAGTPVITLLGNHFCSRVSASVLTAAKIDNLITKSLKEYEKLAIELANNPDKLRKIYLKLKKGKQTGLLFNTAGYTANIEESYRLAWNLYANNKRPKNIYING